MSENIFEWIDIKGNVYGRIEAIRWVLDHHSDIEIIANFDIEPFYNGSKFSTITYDDALKYAANRLDGAMLMAEGPLFMNVEKWRPAALYNWIKSIDYLYALTRKANIYAIDLEKNRDEVNDFYTNPVDPFSVTVNPEGYILPWARKPMKALEFNMLEFLEVGKIPANELYSIWVHFETGIVYCICGKDSQIEGEMSSLIPAAVNITSTEELRELYETSSEFRDMCARLVNKLDKK